MIMNQTPEQMARDNIDRQLSASGWIVQNKKQMNLNAGLGVAVREYQTDAGPAYSFHRLETFQEWFKRGKSLRQRFFDIPDLQTNGLRDCQITAIHNLEDSFRSEDDLTAPTLIGDDPAILKGEDTWLG